MGRFSCYRTKGLCLGRACAWQTALTVAAAAALWLIAAAAGAAIPSDVSSATTPAERVCQRLRRKLEPSRSRSVGQSAGPTGAENGGGVLGCHPQLARRRSDRRLRQQTIQQMGRRPEGQEQRRDALGRHAGPQGTGRSGLRARTDPARRPGRPSAGRGTFSGVQAGPIRPGTRPSGLAHFQHH